MALYIYTDRAKVPEDMKIIDFNDSYFDVFTTIEDTQLVRTILAAVDKAEYHSNKSFIGRTKDLGALNKNMLSTGTKTLLNIIQHPDICFNTIECGANALQFLPLIKNGNVIWKVPVLPTIPDGSSSFILNHYMQFSNFYDLQTYVMDKKGEDL